MVINVEGYRKVFGAVEGMKEDRISSFQWLRGRGVTEAWMGAQAVVIRDECAVCWRLWKKCFPRPSISNTIVQFYRNVFSVNTSPQVKSGGKDQDHPRTGGARKLLERKPKW